MIGKNGTERSTCYQGDFPVSPTALQARGWERKTPGTSGRTCLEQYGQSVPGGSWQRMFADLLVGTGAWSSTRCSLIWKLRDTKSSRSFFQLLASTPPIEGNGSGSSDAEGAKRTDRGAGQLQPTSTTGANSNSRNAVQRLGKALQRHGVALGLAQVAEISLGILPREFDNWQQVPDHYRRLLPTPTAASDARGGCTRREPHRQNGNLANAMHGIFGTHGGSSQLNPLFVMEVMGFPPDWTVLPFQNGGQKA